MVDCEFSPTAKCVKPAKCQRTLSWLKMSGREKPWKRTWGGNKRRKLVHMCLCDSDMAEHLTSLCRLMRGLGLNYCSAEVVTCFFWQLYFELHYDLPCSPDDKAFNIPEFRPSKPLVRYQKLFPVCLYHNSVMTQVSTKEMQQTNIQM